MVSLHNETRLWARSATFSMLDPLQRRAVDAHSLPNQTIAVRCDPSCQPFGFSRNKTPLPFWINSMPMFFCSTWIFCPTEPQNSRNHGRQKFNVNTSLVTFCTNVTDNFFFPFFEYCTPPLCWNLSFIVHNSKWSTECSKNILNDETFP